MKTLDYNELLSLLEDIKGVTFAEVFTNTDARLLKTGNPYNGVRKLTKSRFTIGASYGNAVVREGTRQGIEASSFTPEPLPWGEWVIGGKVITHKGRLYLRQQTTPNQRDAAQVQVLGYVSASGETLTREDVSAWIPTRKESQRQQEVGLNRTVRPLTYAFDSIVSIKLNGEEYKLDNGQSASVADTIAKLEDKLGLLYSKNSTANTSR